MQREGRSPAAFSISQILLRSHSSSVRSGRQTTCSAQLRVRSSGPLANSDPSRSVLNPYHPCSISLFVTSTAASFPRHTGLPQHLFALCLELSSGRPLGVAG